MIKVVQFGEGNFLRTFADYYFDNLNKEGNEYQVNIVKPIKFGTLEKFEKQNNKYHIILRGSKDGNPIEDVHKIDVIQSVVDPFADIERFYALAQDKDLKIVVSNTTEAGICFNKNDKINDFEGVTYPAKLTKFLFARYSAGLGGLYMMPVELIDNNADELSKCVSQYIDLWKLPESFKKWNNEQNFYCNTLVDRIVSGYPKTQEDIDHIEKLLGEKDELVSIGEPFGLWAVEDKGNIKDYIKDGVHGIEVVLTRDIKYYKKRKVRVLNGSHTNIVPAGLWHGAITVYDCMTDKKLSDFLLNTLEDEIVPFVSSDINATKHFADSIVDRFMNPFLNHQLISISLNSISKWKARNLPSFADYYAMNGKVAPNLTIGFSYLMAIYSSIENNGESYIAKLPTKAIEIKDDKTYLDFFANGGKIADFMKDKNVWGENLDSYKDFVSIVLENMEKIKKGISLI